MPLFQVTPSELVAAPRTTFADVQLYVRSGLRWLLREYVEAIDVDVLILAEEFGGLCWCRRASRRS